MTTFFETTIKNNFKNILIEALSGNDKKKMELVAYTECLVDIPNEKVDLLVRDVVNDILLKYNKKKFSENLRRIINEGINQFSLKDNTNFDDNLFNKVNNYYSFL